MPFLTTHQQQLYIFLLLWKMRRVFRELVIFIGVIMNPQQQGSLLISRNASMPSKIFMGTDHSKKVRPCHSQVNAMAQMGTSWRLRNNFLHTRTTVQSNHQHKKQQMSRKLCQTLTDLPVSDEMTKTMLKRLKTEAQDIDKTPKLVTGMVKLKQMHLLMARDLKKVTYEGKRKRVVDTDYHCRKTNAGYGRSLCGRFYTS